MLENHCDCKPKNIELVQQVKDNMPAFDDIMDLSDFFKIMGDSTRLQLLIDVYKRQLLMELKKLLLTEKR